MNTKQQGDRGEYIASHFLEQKGFEILERNYRYKRAELDLICLKDNLLIFVEVKARTRKDYGMPEDAVNDHKITQLQAAAEDYIYAINWQKDIRFDIVSVNLKDEKDILHIEDAFY